MPDKIKFKMKASEFDKHMARYVPIGVGRDYVNGMVEIRFRGEGLKLIVDADYMEFKEIDKIVPVIIQFNTAREDVYSSVRYLLHTLKFLPAIQQAEKENTLTFGYLMGKHKKLVLGFL